MGDGQKITGRTPPRKSRGGWYALAEEGGYVLARHWPPRWDVSATSEFPPVRPGKLANQIRQDLWRKLQGLRGFSPVVQIAPTEEGLKVRAGGRLMGRAPNGTELLIQNLLDDPALRARWVRWAGLRS
ncbi:hypothetical protein [Antarctobacter jejuensis]|uniref:hypothetical protein n=1 Tax=Antarctobacter jejuensis TaxID=1439938 RepID=UPI003FD57C05